MSRRASRRTNSWPFWLLIVAWFCANSPQIATYTFIAWLAHAPHFSHQQQLRRDVAFLLAGQEQPDHLLAHAEQQAKDHPQPAIPATAVLKKIDLTTEAIVNVSPPAVRKDETWRVGEMWGNVFRSPPLHGPPRDGALS